MSKYCDLDINLDGTWQPCGRVKLGGEESAGVAAPTSFEYGSSYLDQNENVWGKHDRSAVSVRFLFPSNVSTRQHGAHFCWI